MSRLALDTSAYSAFMRGHRGVVASIAGARDVAVCTTVIGELLAGFRAGGHESRNRGELARFLRSPRVRFFPLGEETAETYAVILHGLRQAGRPIPTNDLWIAASAMENGYPLLTLDAHFLEIPQIRVIHHAVERPA